MPVEQRKLVAFLPVTVTGLGADIEGPVGDWFTLDPEVQAYVLQQFDGTEAVVFGRDSFSAATPWWDALATGVGSDSAFSRSFGPVLRSARRVVVTDSSVEAPGTASEISERSRAEIAQLLAEPGQDILVLCGPALLSTLLGLGLVHELRLVLCPMIVAAGGGDSFSLGSEKGLALLETRTFSNGAVGVRYGVQGPDGVQG
jgi:dihydrofolate reductase